MLIIIRLYNLPSIYHSLKPNHLIFLKFKYENTHLIISYLFSFIVINYHTHSYAIIHSRLFERQLFFNICFQIQSRLSHFLFTANRYRTIVFVFNGAFIDTICCRLREPFLEHFFTNQKQGSLSSLVESEKYLLTGSGKRFAH